MTDVRIIPTAPRGDALVLKLIGRDTLTGGAGGWTDVPRPRRRAGVQWEGTPGYTTVVPLLLDGLRDDRLDVSVERECQLLDALGRPTDRTNEPPVLRLIGPLKAPATARWVIHEIFWGDELRDRRDRRVYQPVTVTFKQYLEVAVYSHAKANRDKHKKN